MLNIDIQEKFDREDKIMSRRKKSRWKHIDHTKWQNSIKEKLNLNWKKSLKIIEKLYWKKK